MKTDVANVQLDQTRKVSYGEFSLIAIVLLTATKLTYGLRTAQTKNMFKQEKILTVSLKTRHICSIFTFIRSKKTAVTLCLTLKLRQTV